MTHNEHQHGHSHEHGHQHHNGAHKRKGLHKDWRAWVVVLLMLAAMAAYILTDNEAIRPGSNGPNPQVPAAPAAP